MMKEVGISELFEYYDSGKNNSLAESKEGPYPCVSCSAYNNGISKYIDTYDYDTDKLGFSLLTVPGTADVFYCFAQSGKFSARTGVHLLKLKNKSLDGMLGLIGYLMSQEFSNGKYSYHSGAITKERLMNETITLPVIVRGISDKLLKMLANGETTLNELTNNGKNKDYTYEINENLLNNFVYTMMM